jgi:hypothetical protein
MKSIYPKEPQEQKNEDNVLVEGIANMRARTTSYFENANRFIDSITGKFIKLEQAVDPAERKVESALLVAISGFAGSIISKNANIRFMTPLGLIVSIGILYPKTVLKAIKI